MIDGELFPRLRAGVHVDTAQPPFRVTLGDADLWFKGVPDPLVASIVARFDGARSLDHISADYGKAAPVVALIAAEMRKRRMLLLARSSRTGWEPDLMLRATSSVDYIADRVADPAPAAARWRDNPIVVTGHGRSFVLALSGLVDAGAGDLAIGADRAADRMEIENRLTAAAHAGAQCRHRWIEPDEVIDPETLVVRVVDGDVFDEGGDWATATRSHAGPGIWAGVVRGAGVVARVRAGKAPSKPLLPPTPADAPGLVTDYARAVIGSLAAFQALNATIADDETERYGLLPLSDIVVVRADGGMYAADAGAPRGDVQAPAPGVSVRSPFQIEREQWTALARPFLAAPAPLLAWADDLPLPTFPLPHRGLHILPGHGSPDQIVTPWAVSPSEITARTIRVGLEALADRLTGESGHTAAQSKEEWTVRAYLAWAEPLAPSIPDTAPARRLTYDDSADVGFRTLVRLIGLYLDEPPVIAIAVDPRSGAPRADVSVGSFHRFALGSSVLHATVEALGRTLSAYQLRQPPSLSSATGIVLPCDLDLDTEVQFEPERLGLAPKMLDRIAGLPTEGIMLGRFRSADSGD
jgi:hypothetical protein